MLARTAVRCCVSAHARMDDLIAEGNTNGYWIGIDARWLFLAGRSLHHRTNKSEGIRRGHHAGTGHNSR